MKFALTAPSFPIPPPKCAVLSQSYMITLPDVAPIPCSPTRVNKSCKIKSTFRAFLGFSLEFTPFPQNLKMFLIS